MCQTKTGFVLLLTVLSSIIIAWNLTENHSDITESYVKNKAPTYRSQNIITIVYDPTGKISYKIIAKNMYHYSDDKTSWFSQPILITYDQDTQPTWSIRADKAKIIDNHMLYLHGSVEANSLLQISQLKKITADNVHLNLVTQDISADHAVTVYGSNFTSSGLKMRGNMQEKTARLMNNVKTYYEIQNKTKNN
ncbi:LPS export ABC transporter periplasmic protein LptC [Candidatus Profftia tarda]|uniref:Lipopolysaccharide export system protein LptC n=1 Tax=Candidatus Profftia tarda TaxID=1177216 RepID=A0A8E4EXY5_9ENTR|nr:LPS export ABC transporter periplasmic protein LptC [Candidatus Profftia tarda]CAD6507895.1 Lipopolysaccharide export system protein LptC [Candidatus Profftia tarda]